MLAHSITLVACKTPVNAEKPDNTPDVSDYPARRKYMVWHFHAVPFFLVMIKEPLVKSGASRLRWKIIKFKAWVARAARHIAKTCNTETEPGDSALQDGISWPGQGFLSPFTSTPHQTHPDGHGFIFSSPVGTTLLSGFLLFSLMRRFPLWSVIFGNPDSPHESLLFQKCEK